MLAKGLKKSSDGKIELINATESDEKFLAEVYTSTKVDEFAPLGWDEEQLAQFLAMQYGIQKQAYRLQFPDAENLIVGLDEKKIGRMIVERNASEIRLVDISLLPPFRNLGVGTKIISDLLNEAEAQDLPLTLQVARNNPSAFRLYQKLGFQITGEDEMYISMEWKKIKE